MSSAHEPEQYYRGDPAWRSFARFRAPGAILLALVSVLCAMAGCGRGGGSDSQDRSLTPQDRVLLEYPFLATDVVCDLVERCCGPVTMYAAEEVGGGCDVVVGVPNFASVLEVRASVASGRSLYDSDALHACEAGQSAASCEELDTVRVPPGCEAPWLVPQVDLGDACGLSFECIDGHCVGADRDAAAQAADGRCEALRAAGNDCDSDAQCASRDCSTLLGRCQDADPATALEAACWFD